MGYESRLYIARAPYRDDDGNPTNAYNGAAYCENIAEYDLCKIGADTPIAKLIGESITAEKARVEAEGWRYGIYETADGDTQHVKDKYGDPVAPVPLSPLITAIAEALDAEDYRRYAPALALLTAFRDQVNVGRWDPNGLVVLHYGH